MKRIYNPATSNVANPHVDGALAVQDEPGSQEKLGTILLINVPETLARWRASHQMFARTQEDDFRRTHLSEMHLQVHSLAGSAGPIGFRKIAQMTGALEALLI